jgi:hypothetical protein
MHFYQGNVIILNILEMFIIAERKKQDRSHLQDSLDISAKPIKILKIFSSRTLALLCELSFF